MPLGPSTLEGGYKVFGSFLQDTWRIKPNLTLTGGLRYDVTTPFVPSSSVMSAVTMASICGRSGVAGDGLYDRCNFMSPGRLDGGVPEFIQLAKGTEGYKTDFDNIAPSASIAWRPNVQSGLLRKLLGDPDQATLRAGYSEAYDRQGLTRFTGLYGNNRGASVSLNRTANTGIPTLVPAGESWPVLLSQTNRLSPSSFNEDPRTRSRSARTGPTGSMPSRPTSRSRTCEPGQSGFARSISKDMAVEIRYIGNRGNSEWEAINYNSIRTENLVANGFLNEFKVAMANLRANNASGTSGRVGSFAYFGSGTGTSPLPIYLAYLNGRRDADNPAAYGLNPTGGTLNPSNTWANSTIAGRLARTEPQPDRRRRRSRRQPHAPQPGPGDRLRHELLRAEPGCVELQRDRQRRVQQVQRAADRAAPTSLERLLGEHELPVRVRGRVGLRRFQLRPRVDQRSRHR